MLQKNIFCFCSNWRIMWTSSLIISIFHFHQNSVSKINLLINSKCQVNSYKSLINFLKQSKYQNLLWELCMRARIKIFSLCWTFLMKVLPSKKNNWKVYESFISCWWYFEYNMVGLKISQFGEIITKDPNHLLQIVCYRSWFSP